MSKEKWYSLNKIDKTEAVYRIIIGKRSNGKTYSICNKCIINYFKNGYRLAYIRRWEESIMPKNISSLFKEHLPLIEKLSKGKWNDYEYVSRAFRLVRKENGKIVEKDSQTFCECFALNTWETSKGADRGFFKYILFDEFMTRRIYLDNEFVIFCNVLSSIIRNRDGTIIYMCANTVNKYCPYFSEMGLGKIENLKQGEIKIYTYGFDSDLSVAIEYCDINTESKKVNKYFAFDNPQLNMITQGTWEIKNYPHSPCKITNDKIVKKFYIQFNLQLICGNIVQIDDYIFLFFHMQTKEINLNNEILYTFTPDIKPLHVQTINDVPTKAHQIIKTLIKENKCFYSDNSVGELFRNWYIEQSNFINNILN